MADGELIAAYSPAMRYLASAVLALMLTGCGGGGTESADPEAPVTVTETITSTPTYLGDPTEASTPTSPPLADPNRFDPNVGERALKVGQPRIGRDITTVLLETDLGVTAEYRVPEDGKQFLGMRISTCVDKNADLGQDPLYSTYNGEWYAVTKSGDQYTGGGGYIDFPSPKYPENVTLGAGDCLKGWIAIEVPADVNRFQKIVYRAGGDTVAEWMLR